MNYRIITAVLPLLLTACASQKVPLGQPTGEGDLSYLLSANPAAVTDADLAAHEAYCEKHAEQYHLSYGIVFQGYRDTTLNPNPTFYGSGGDSMLFTGFRLAMCALRYKVTGEQADFDKVLEAVRGLYILTHATGTPGVLCRAAFPQGREAFFRYPEQWGGRDPEFLGTGPALPDPLDSSVTMPPFIYYTRATRDQLSGLFYGLGVCWHELTGDDPKSVAARRVIAQIVSDVYGYLEANNFQIVNQRGNNDTNADTVDDLLMLEILSVYQHTVQVSSPLDAGEIEARYVAARDSLLDWGFYFGDIFNRFTNAGSPFGLRLGQYYAWNLRVGRVFTVWLLEPAGSRKRDIYVYFRDWIWKHVKGHQNAFFTLTHDAMAWNPSIEPSGGAMDLKSWSLRPLRNWTSPVAVGGKHEDLYSPPCWLSRVLGLADDDVLPPHLRDPATYWTWQGDPWDPGYSEPYGQPENMGLDFQLPYWLGRRFGLINAP